MPPQKPITTSVKSTDDQKLNELTSAIGAGKPVRIITTKFDTYLLPADETGIPVAEYFPGVQFPAALAGAKVYETTGGPVITLPANTSANTPKRPGPARTPRQRRRGHNNSRVAM